MNPSIASTAAVENIIPYMTRFVKTKIDAATSIASTTEIFMVGNNR